MFLSVDGGGTKINVIAFDEKLKLKGYGSGGGINLRFETKERADEHIKKAIQECMGNASVKIDKVYCTMVCSQDIFLENARDLGFEIDEMVRMPEGYTYLLAGALSESGFVALAGTGSGAVYCDGKDKILHIGGYGTPIGDDGGGSWIGIKGINAVTRHLSGWGEKTSLTEKLFEYLGIKQSEGNILAALYPEDKSIRSLYAKFTKSVGEAANEGDSVAKEIVNEAGILMAKQIIGIAKMYKNVETKYIMNNIYSGGSELLSDKELLELSLMNIYACGGAWKCSPLMFESFENELKGKIPNAICRKSIFDPVVGGVIKYIIDKGDKPEMYLDYLKTEYKIFR